MSERVLTIERMSAGYGNLAVVRDLTMHVDRGELVALEVEDLQGLQPAQFRRQRGELVALEVEVLQGLQLADLAPDRRQASIREA